MFYLQSIRCLWPGMRTTQFSFFSAEYLGQQFNRGPLREPPNLGLNVLGSPPCLLLRSLAHLLFGSTHKSPFSSDSSVCPLRGFCNAAVRDVVCSPGKKVLLWGLHLGGLQVAIILSCVDGPKLVIVPSVRTRG